MQLRTIFLETAAVACDLLATSDVAIHWDKPSALPEMTVGDLAGHLARGVTTVQSYLERTTPLEVPQIDAAGYIVGFGDMGELQSELNQSIRQRSRDVASVGHAALVADTTATLAALKKRLGTEPSDRALSVIQGLVMQLDEYLATRMIELTVHIDDLAASLGREAPSIDESAYTVVIETLIEIARRRRGDEAVLRALTRAERAANVFPVL